MLMAVQGPLARTVRDARLALRSWRGRSARLALDRRADAGPPPARPIQVALVPEVPGGTTHPAQAEAVRQAGTHLQAAGYVVEEVLPPDIERGVELWHRIGATDVFGTLWPQMQKHGEPDGIASMAHGSTCTADRPAGVLAALTERDVLLLRWLTFLHQWPAGHPADARRPAAAAGRRHRRGRARADPRFDARRACSRRCSACPASPCRSACTARCAPACRSWRCASARICASTPAR